jgi:hypothetical protein
MAHFRYMDTYGGACADFLEACGGHQKQEVLRVVGEPDFATYLHAGWVW